MKVAFFNKSFIDSQCIVIESTIYDISTIHHAFEFKSLVQRTHVDFVLTNLQDKYYYRSGTRTWTRWGLISHGINIRKVCHEAGGY